MRKERRVKKREGKFDSIASLSSIFSLRASFFLSTLLFLSTACLSPSSSSHVLQVRVGERVDGIFPQSDKSRPNPTPTHFLSLSISSASCQEGVLRKTTHVSTLSAARQWHLHGETSLEGPMFYPFTYGKHIDIFLDFRLRWSHLSRLIIQHTLQIFWKGHILQRHFLIF